MANIPVETKSPVKHLQLVNLLVALIAGLISVAGGIYTLKVNFFSPKNGDLHGFVMDQNIQKPLYKAELEISDTNGAVISTVKTDDDGKYLMNTLKEGNYVVKATAPFHEVQSKNVRIIGGSDAGVDFNLVPEEKHFSKGDNPLPDVRTVPNEPPRRYYPQEGPGSPTYQGSQTQYSRRRRHYNPQPGSDMTSDASANASTAEAQSPLTGILGQVIEAYANRKKTS